MPAHKQAKIEVEEPVKVLLTGFGPFGMMDANPAWQAVSLLHNRVVESQPAPLKPRVYYHTRALPPHKGPLWPDNVFARPTNGYPSQARRGRKIHITSAEMPVSYRTVLATIPPLFGLPRWTSSDWEQHCEQFAPERKKALEGAVLAGQIETEDDEDGSTHEIVNVTTFDSESESGVVRADQRPFFSSQRKRKATASPPATPTVPQPINEPLSPAPGPGEIANRRPLWQSKALLGLGGDEKEPFDLVVHTGVGHSPCVKLELRAARWGYETCLPDIDGWDAPAEWYPDDLRPPSNRPNKKDDEGVDRAPNPPKADRPRRGFVGDEWAVTDASEEDLKEGYEWMRTSVDVEGLKRWSRDRMGMGPFVRGNDDAGEFLCEHIFYASLACARRNARARGLSDDEATPVLFVHVPPINDPYSAEELAQVIEGLVWALVNENFAGLPGPHTETQRGLKAGIDPLLPSCLRN